MKFLRLLAASALMLCAALAFAADADPPAVVGRLNYISGPVSFAPAEANEDWTVAALNRPITTGDRLWTDSNGRAELHVGSLAIRMSAHTSLDVLALDERTLQLRLPQGDLNLRVRRIASDQLLEIATPRGAVVVKRPGSYRIDADPAGSATVVTVRLGGQAEVFTGNSSFTVGNNQEAEISGHGQSVFLAPSPDDFDQWAAARDDREDRVVATRYVPEDMTGYEDLDRYGSWRPTPEYGPVWTPASVPAGWAPYRYGHWVWIAPWGWTWVDDAPWGFAPFHYGRWVWLGNHWAWAPGRRIARPVYAPALVAFIGGANFSASIGFGNTPAIGWVPLGWHEPYRPWYRASRAHVHNVNITNVTTVTNVDNREITHANRRAPSGVTVVSREDFVTSRRVQRASLDVPARRLDAVSVVQDSPPARPTRASLAGSQAGARPPAAAGTREAVAVNRPPAPATEAAFEGREGGRNARFTGNDERPRVRVIDRQERVDLPRVEAQRGSVRAMQSAAEAPRSERSDRAERTEQQSGREAPPARQDARRAP